MQGGWSLKLPSIEPWPVKTLVNSITISDFCLFGPIMKHLPGKQFASDADRKQTHCKPWCYHGMVSMVIMCGGLMCTICNPYATRTLTLWQPVTQICVFALQLRKMDDVNLRFNTRLVFTHLITQYMERLKNGPPGRMFNTLRTGIFSSIFITNH
jgi:hypothetical protein